MPVKSNQKYDSSFLLEFPWAYLYNQPTSWLPSGVGFIKLMV